LHWSMADRMLSCDIGGHIFLILCCSHSMTSGSLWFLYTNCFSSFKTWQSNGFRTGEFSGNSVDLTNSTAASASNFKVKVSILFPVCFRSQMRVWDTIALLGPIERDNVKHGTSEVSFLKDPREWVSPTPSPEDGNRCSFRNIVFCSVV
jgi:hypothetical protein